MATLAALPAIKTQTDTKRLIVRRRNLRAVAFMVIDCLLAFAAFFSTGALIDADTSIMSGVIGALIVPLSFIATGFYDQTRVWSPWQVLYECLKGTAVATAVFGLLTVGSPELSLGVLHLALGLVWAVGLSAAWRLLAFDRFSNVPERRILVLSQDDLACSVTDELLSQRHPGYRLVQASVNVVSDAVQSSATDPSTLTSSSVDVVAVSPLTPIAQETRELLVRSVERGVSIVSLLSVYEELTHRIPLRFLDENWFSEVAERNHRRQYDAGKRLLDVGVALIGLCLTGLLLPFIALAMAVGGGSGPLFYSQTRVGLKGQPFTIYKFRSMALDAEKDGPLWAAKNDDRVTKVGRLLRQTRLDELPQFWNVLKGEMSMVGPRPERPEFVTTLKHAVPFYEKRHDVLPGLTGWAQVMFPYGASVSDTAEKLQYDLYYIKHRSFYLDLKIMLKTIGVMILKIGGR